MKRIIPIIIILLFIAGLAYGIVFYYQHLRGAFPALKPPPKDIAALVPQYGEPSAAGKNETSFPLLVPQGFSISILANNVPGARDILVGPDNHLWASQPSRGTVSRISLSAQGTHQAEITITGLNRPHGMVFDNEHPAILFVAQENALVAIDTSNNMRMTTLLDLPSGGRHTTRSLIIGADNRLYVSIGSSCDVCYESHPWRATIISVQKDGTDARIEAKGLRNAVFMAVHPSTGAIWVTEMGRDFLGDDLPPDEINILASGGDYGWPLCYGNNVHDASFDKNTYIRNPCEDRIGAYIELQAHSAPLGIGFIPKEGWPESMRHDAIVAYHGSWNRSAPTGYKLMRIMLDEQGNEMGREDFITGWLTREGALGRPVDVEILPNGIMYISDDKAGVIYALSYEPQ